MQINENIYLKNTAEDLLDRFEEVLPSGMGDLASAEGISALGIDKLISEILSLISGGIGSVAPVFLLALGGGMLAALGSLVGTKMSGRAASMISVILSLSLLAVLYPSISAALGALGELSGFFGSLMPVVSAIPILGGGVSTGATASMGMQLTLWIMGGVCGSVLPAVIASMLAASALGDIGGVGELGRGVKSVFTKVIGISTAVLAGITALQTFISVCADSATMRLAKYAASDMIPVVGGAVSGALATLAGGLSYAGGIIGAGSVAAILSIALSPLVMLLLYKLALEAAQTVCSSVSGSVSCISGLSGVLDALISVYVMTIIIYIFDIITIVSGGVGIIG